MQIKVRLKKGALDHFRKLARNSPNEILSYLEGEVVSPGLMVIHKFHYTKNYGTSTPEHVAWYLSDYQDVVKKAEGRGRRIVGFIHSHPEWDAVLSPDDHKVCITEMHRVCGICSTYKGKTRVRFWVMDSALPCEIIYEKDKGASPRP